MCEGGGRLGCEREEYSGWVSGVERTEGGVGREGLM